MHFIYTSSGFSTSFPPLNYSWFDKYNPKKGYVSIQDDKKIIADLVESVQKYRMHIKEEYVGDRNASGQFHGKGSLIYADGTFYDGEWKDGKRYGQGKYIDAVGDVYEGRYKDGKLNGHGTHTLFNGDIYEGEFKNDQKNGQGTYVHADDGTIYEGQFKDDQKHGQGKGMYSNGDIYEGKFKNGRKNGQGTYFHADDGTIYEGQFKDDQKHGQGKSVYTSGDIYEGEFKYDRFDGRGYISFASGDSHEGAFQGGLANGQGTSRYPNGDIYEGNWKHARVHGAQKHGQGRYSFGSGDVYDGEWKENKRHGQGRYTWSFGEVYNGEWVDDIQRGKGEQTYKNGDVYVGEWLGGLSNGQGIYLKANGNVYDGRYKDGKRNGHGTHTLTNGDVYKGEWKDGKRHGQGKCMYADGRVYVGNWAASRPYGQGKLITANGHIYEGEFKNGEYLNPVISLVKTESKSLDAEIQGQVTEDIESVPLAPSYIEYLTIYDASKAGDLEQVISFVESDRDINETDHEGCTALIWAAKNGHLHIVQCIVERGADVTIYDKEGCTALIHAAKNGNLPIVEYLVEHGADVAAKDNDGSDALVWAAKNRHFDILQYLSLALQQQQAANQQSDIKSTASRVVEENPVSYNDDNDDDCEFDLVTAALKASLEYEGLTDLLKIRDILKQVPDNSSSSGSDHSNYYRGMTLAELKQHYPSLPRKIDSLIREIEIEMELHFGGRHRYPPKPILTREDFEVQRGKHYSSDLCGNTVALFHPLRQGFVQSREDGSFGIVDDKREWESFKVVDAGAGEVALYNTSHSRFLRIDPDTFEVNALGGDKEETELPPVTGRFRIKLCAEGKAAFYSPCLNRFLRISGDQLDAESGVVDSEKSLPDDWMAERFIVDKYPQHSKDTALILCDRTRIKCLIIPPLENREGVLKSLLSLKEITWSVVYDMNASPVPFPPEYAANYTLDPLQLCNILQGCANDSTDVPVVVIAALQALTSNGVNKLNDQLEYFPFLLGINLRYVALAFYFDSLLGVKLLENYEVHNPDIIASLTSSLKRK